MRNSNDTLTRLAANLLAGKFWLEIVAVQTTFADDMNFHHELIQQKGPPQGGWQCEGDERREVARP